LCSLLCKLKNVKKLLPIFLMLYCCDVLAGWIQYSTKHNGDVFFYDDTRVEISGSEILVWTRIKYKTSIMAASSYQSLLQLDCAKNTETILQSTFYTDKDWSVPAMSTNTNPKPEKKIPPNSASQQLVKVLCKNH